MITVTRSQREFLAKAFGVTKEMVSYALNFHPVKGQSDLAKKIRSLAVQRGGFLSLLRLLRARWCMTQTT